MSKIGEHNYDGLISDLSPAIFVGAGTIRKGAAKATYVRGTVFAKSDADDKLVILGTDPAAATEKFNGDGSAVTFTLTGKPEKVTSVKVSGTAVTFTYDASTGVVTCASAPAAGTDNVVVTYDGEVLTPAAILCEDLEVGTSTDENAAVYLAGCFDPDKLVVKTGYTVTEADKDALRNGGIFLKAAAK